VRLKSAVTLLLLALVTAPPVTVSGQEEPLPVVVARAEPFAELPSVVLAVEPIRDFRQPTLLDAAHANDYATFDALYREAKARGESLGAYDTLHELWTYSVNDPIGAFYGTEFYERLARVYPGYARFIDDYRIVDDRGAVFYPTSETRAFLLDRVVEGNAPRALLADLTPARLRNADSPQSTAAAARRNRRSTPATEASTQAASASAPAERRRSASPSNQVSRSTAGTTGTRTADRNAGVSVSTERTATDAAVTRSASTAPAAAVTPRPVELPPVRDTPPVVADTPSQAAPVPAVSQPPVVEAVPAPAPVVERESGFATRGILLLVLGVIGIGLLAVMLRASEKKPAGVITGKPVTPFEAVKKPAAPGPQAVPPASKDEKNRATGSRG
jgi:hypothetical protein